MVKSQPARLVGEAEGLSVKDGSGLAVDLLVGAQQHQCGLDFAVVIEMPLMGLFIWGAGFPEAFVRLTANERGEVDGELWDQHELVDAVTDLAREIKEPEGLVVLCPRVRILTDNTMIRILTSSSVASHLDSVLPSEMASLSMSI